MIDARKKREINKRILEFGYELLDNGEIRPITEARLNNKFLHNHEEKKYMPNEAEPPLILDKTDDIGLLGEYANRLGEALNKYIAEEIIPEKTDSPLEKKEILPEEPLSDILKEIEEKRKKPYEFT